MANAIIKSDRPAAAIYNGMAARIVRKVEEGDAGFTDKNDQVIAIVNDREHYFYADEVVKGDATRHVMAREEMPYFDKDRHAATPDQAAWDNASTLNTVSSMEYYLMQFPTGTRAAEARQRRSQMAPGLPQLAPVPKEMQPPKPPEPASASSAKDTTGKDGSAIAAANIGYAKDEERVGVRTQSANQGIDPPPKPLDVGKDEDRSAPARNQSEAAAKAKGQ